MVTGIATTLFEFQEEAVIKLLDLCSWYCDGNDLSAEASSCR